MLITTVLGFLSDSRDEYYNWKGEWSAVSAMVVLAPTIGATFPNSLYRVMGTVLGMSNPN